MSPVGIAPGALPHAYLDMSGVAPLAVGSSIHPGASEIEKYKAAYDALGYVMTWTEADPDKWGKGALKGTRKA